MSRIVHVAVIAAMASLGVTAIAIAQTSRAEDATIGFAFTAGNTTLPAGQYTVSVDMADPTVLLIQSRDRQVTTWVDTTMVHGSGNAPSAGDSELVFDRYGDQYFLREAWIHGEAHQAQPSSLMARAERQAAAQHQSPRVERIVTRPRG